MHTYSPYIFQIPPQGPAKCDNEDRKDSCMMQQAEPEPISPFQNHQFSPQQQFHPQSSPTPFVCASGQNNYHNNYPSQWSEHFQMAQDSYAIPCYYHPSANTDVHTYINPPYLENTYT